MRVQTSALPEVEPDKAKRMAHKLTAWFHEHKRELPYSAAVISHALREHGFNLFP